MVGELKDGELTKVLKKKKVFSFKTFGPLTLLPAEISQFWSETDANKHRNGLRSAIGVYIFATKRTKSSPLLPRYVGKTNRGFEERFKEHQRDGVLRELKDEKGRLHVFLLARLTDDELFFRKSRNNLMSIDRLETLLIERCLLINKELMNRSKVQHFTGLKVPGFINSPKHKPTGPARELRRLLGTVTWKEL